MDEKNKIASKNIKDTKDISETDFEKEVQELEEILKKDKKELTEDELEKVMSIEIIINQMKKLNNEKLEKLLEEMSIFLKEGRANINFRENFIDENAIYQEVAQGMPASMLLDMGLEVGIESISEVTEEALEGVLENMLDTADKTPSSKGSAYLVRGATLMCDKGSQSIRLNLQMSHGSYIHQKALMHNGDVSCGEAGENFNITSFKVCTSPSNQNGPTISMPKEPPRDINGNFSGAPSMGVAVGKKCIPEVIGLWQKPHMLTKVGIDGYVSITEDSFLVCKYGGIIKAVKHGQID